MGSDWDIEFDEQKAHDARQERRRVEEEAHAALLDRCESWKQLAFLLDNLLVCYRLGRQPSGKLLDGIRRLKDRLGYDSEREK